MQRRRQRSRSLQQEPRRRRRQHLGSCWRLCWQQHLRRQVALVEEQTQMQWVRQQMVTQPAAAQRQQLRLLRLLRLLLLFRPPLPLRLL